MVGSSPTAKAIASAAGAAGKRTVLLGGAKNYLVVMEDVQWDVFIQNYIFSCYGSVGQRCLAGSIVAAEPEVHDEMVERIMVGVNVGIPTPHPYLPFGGIKDSLVGSDKVQGKEGIDFFTQNKIATRGFAPPSGQYLDIGREGETTVSKTGEVPSRVAR